MTCGAVRRFTTLAVLTPAERQAIKRTFFAELTHAEAAARLGQPLGTIKTRIRSGLHKLRRAHQRDSRGDGPDGTQIIGKSSGKYQVRLLVALLLR